MTATLSSNKPILILLSSGQITPMTCPILGRGAAGGACLLGCAKRFPQASLFQQRKYVTNQPVEPILEIEPRAQDAVGPLFGQRFELVCDFASRAQDWKGGRRHP